MKHQDYQLLRKHRYHLLSVGHTSLYSGHHRYEVFPLDTVVMSRQWFVPS